MDYDTETGPPSWEDDAWFLEHVVAAGYPKPKRAPKPLTGEQQLALIDDLKQAVETRDQARVTHGHPVIEPRPDGLYLNGEPVE